MTIERFDHYTVRAADLDATWYFYEHVLGLRVEQRTGTPLRGALVYVGEQAMVHLFQATPELENVFSEIAAPDASAVVAAQGDVLPENQRGLWRTGRVHHISFRASGYDAMKARLDANGGAVRERTLPAGDRVVLVNDPDGVEIELFFANLSL